MEYMDKFTYMVNTMAADDLVTQGTRASAAMVPIKFYENIPVTALEDWTTQIHNIIVFCYTVYVSVTIRCTTNHIVML